MRLVGYYEKALPTEQEILNDLNGWLSNLPEDYEDFEDEISFSLFVNETYNYKDINDAILNWLEENVTLSVKVQVKAIRK